VNADNLSDEEANEQTKDVYAHFGLAMYYAQVLEHGVVNAMIVARTRERHRITRADIDAFLDTQFERTLGQMLQELRRHLQVLPTVEPTLRAALKRRNWLAHQYFRERAVEFMNAKGRSSMIEELQEATALFRNADTALNELTREIQETFGIDDAAIEREMNEVLGAT
jgi:hypothetical protein